MCWIDVCSIHAVKIDSASNVAYKYKHFRNGQSINSADRKQMGTKCGIHEFSWMRDRSSIVIDINLGWFRFGWEMLSCIVFAEINSLDKYSIIIIKCVNNKHTHKHLSVAFHLIRIASQFGWVTHKLSATFALIQRRHTIRTHRNARHANFQRNGMCTIYYEVPRRV